MLSNFISTFPLIKRINDSPKAKELFTNSFWAVLGAILSKGLLFLAWIIVARILGSDGYGQFGIVRSTVLMFATFAGFSLGITASKHVAEFLSSEKERTGRILGLTMAFGILMGAVIGISFYLLAPWLARETLGAPEITGELRIGALILFFSSLNGAQIGALQGFSAFKLITKISVIQAVICFPLFVFGALYLGVNGTVWAFAISYILICVLSYFAIRNKARANFVKIDYIEAWKERKLLFTYSLPAFLGGLMVTPVKWYTDALLVSESGFSEMGIFTAALTFHSIILVGAGMISAPFISIMAKNKSDNRNSGFSKFNILAPWAIGIFVACPFIVFPELGSLIFGKSYAGEMFELTFIIVLLFTVLIMFKQGLGRIMAVYNLQWWSFFSNMLWGIVLISSFLLFEEQNAHYLAMAYLFAYFINIVIVLPIYYYKKIIPNNTIDSIESIGIWIILIGIAWSGINIGNLIVRGLILIIAILGFGFLFYRNFNLKQNQII